MAVDDWPPGDPEPPSVDLPAAAVPSRSSCSRVLWNSVSVVSLLADRGVFGLANDCPASPFAIAADLAVGEVVPDTLYDGGRPVETEFTAMLSYCPAANLCAPRRQTIAAPVAKYCHCQIIPRIRCLAALITSQIVFLRCAAVGLVTPPQGCAGGVFFKQRYWGARLPRRTRDGWPCFPWGSPDQGPWWQSRS